MLSQGPRVVNLPFLIYFELMGSLKYGLCEEYISAGCGETAGH